MSQANFRFRLSTLLTLLAMVALACGWFTHQRRLSESLRKTQERVALLERQDPTAEPVDPIFAAAVVSKMQADRSRRITVRSDYVGKRVQVEGIALGQPFVSSKSSHSPWAGPHIAFDGATVFVKGIDFVELGLRGKLVRVTGVLHESGALVTRFGDRPKYYYVEVTFHEAIDQVEDPHLVALEEIVSPVIPRRTDSESSW